MTPEQFFPTRWVLYGMTRSELAKHLHSLWRSHGLKTAKKCSFHASWVGVYPVRWRNPETGFWN